MIERANRLAVAICGAGHSGSTLLGLVLGSHSECFYAGEAKKTLFIGDASKPLRKRVCKICGESCRIWSRFTQPPAPDVYEQIARLADRPVVVDSTKKVDWIRARTAELDAVGVPHKRLFLMRDGRAVVNSRARKYPERAPAALVEEWLAQVSATEALIAERPDAALGVRYEALATEPEATFRETCVFLGLPFEPDMLRYETHEHHPLGGNTGTQSVVARAGEPDTRKGGAFAAVPTRSRDYYGSLSSGFRLDLRWREEISRELLDVFETEAGAVNEPFRWDALEGDAR